MISAFRQFVRLLGQIDRRLQTFILLSVPNWNDAEDITQEVRVRLWQQFDSYDVAKDFGAWALAIAKFQVLSFRKRQSHHGELVSTELVETLAEEIGAICEEMGVEEEALQDCIEKLPPAKRELLTRYYSGQQSLREMAAALDKTTTRCNGPCYARMTLNDCVERTVRGGRAMTDLPHSQSDPKAWEVYTLANALLSDTISADDARRLKELVSSDIEARRWYIRFMHQTIVLRKRSLVSLAGQVEQPLDDAGAAPNIAPSTLPTDCKLSTAGRSLFSALHHPRL